MNLFFLLYFFLCVRIYVCVRLSPPPDAPTTPPPSTTTPLHPIPPDPTALLDTHASDPTVTGNRGTVPNPTRLHRKPSDMLLCPPVSLSSLCPFAFPFNCLCRSKRLWSCPTSSVSLGPTFPSDILSCLSVYFLLIGVGEWHAVDVRWVLTSTLLFRFPFVSKVLWLIASRGSSAVQTLRSPSSWHFKDFCARPPWNFKDAKFHIHLQRIVIPNALSHLR